MTHKGNTHILVHGSGNEIAGAKEIVVQVRIEMMRNNDPGRNKKKKKRKKKMQETLAEKYDGSKQQKVW